jgi:hypothetical protein
MAVDVKSDVTILVNGKGVCLSTSSVNSRLSRQLEAPYAIRTTILQYNAPLNGMEVIRRG